MLTGPDAVIDMDTRQYAQLVATASRNGMSRGGTHRVIGEIPLAVYQALVEQAAERGEPLSGETLKRWLNANPAYRTVTAIDSGDTRLAQLQVN